MMRLSEAKRGGLTLRGFTVAGEHGMKFVNVTPHDIHLLRFDGTTETIPPSGTVARVEMVPVTVRLVNGIPVRRNTHGAITGLPDPEPGTIYIASMLVVDNARRNDVVSPDDMVRDEQGRILGCRALATYGKEEPC